MSAARLSPKIAVATAAAAASSPGRQRAWSYASSGTALMALIGRVTTQSPQFRGLPRVWLTPDL
ncbi:hypothetical protein [Cellulomonas soli]|uniref:hypothetical protein n=1 Tax=Cellulomonas soli TaxID=931535 RepID=UPI0015C8A1D6|nr:hypothetical protein [Cellulomonas soli]NYI57444.1 hypothetical protein [Cellulomonas soli]